MMNRAGYRRGMILVGVLIACVVLFIGAFALHFFMRNERMSAYRSVQGECARALARSGLELTQIHLARAFADPDSAVRRRLLAPLGELLSGPEKLGTVDLAASFPELVKLLAQPLARGSAVGGLEARFGFQAKDLGPLPPLTVADRTLPRGDREKRGVIFVECTARVSTGGLFGTLSRSVRALYEFRVVAAPVPLLSDFMLFVQERAAPGAHTAPDPLANLGIDGGGSAPRRATSVFTDLDAMKNRGWVFMGNSPSSGGRAILPGTLLPEPWVGPLGGLDLGRISLADLAPQMARLSCWNAPDATGLRAFIEKRGMLENGRLDLGTTIRSAGALELPALSEVRRGGLLMASQITITGAIPRPAHGVLVLVATEGSIRVPAGVPVHASLMALKGSVILEGATQLFGSVAAARLDVAGLAHGSRLAYDDRFKGRAFGPVPADTLIIDFARKPMLVE